MNHLHALVVLGFSIFGAGLTIGYVIGPERVVERRGKPMNWNEVLACVHEAGRGMRECKTCRSYSAQWAGRMPELWVRNCLDPADPAIGAEIDAWNRGEYGPQ